MTTNYRSVREMHAKFGLILDKRDLEPEEAAKRQSMLEEEVRELRDAIGANDRIKILDALADILYVVYGTAAVYGFDADKAFARVHESNMSKTKPSDPAGKLIKGADYKPVDLSDLV